MRQSFDKHVPLSEQLKRIVKMARGHKHMHTIGPGKPKKQADPMVLNHYRKLKKRVSAYWHGETDEHP